MRLAYCLLLIFGVFTGEAFAQNAPVYNATSYSSGSKTEKRAIYNGSSNFSSGPISIKGLMQGNNQKSGYSSQNGSKPYSFSERESRGGSALSFSPAQIRAKQAADRRRAKERQKLALQQKAEREQRQAALKQDNVSSRTDQFKQQFQEQDTKDKVKKVKRRSVYLQKESTSSTPAPVFNRVN